MSSNEFKVFRADSYTNEEHNIDLSGVTVEILDYNNNSKLDPGEYALIIADNNNNTSEEMYSVSISSYEGESINLKNIDSPFQFSVSGKSNFEKMLDTIVESHSNLF